MFELLFTAGGITFMKLWLLYQSNPVSAIAAIKLLASAGSVVAWEFLSHLGLS